MAPCRAMICHQVTLSGDAEWPKVADAVIEAERNAYEQVAPKWTRGSRPNKRCPLGSRGCPRPKGRWHILLLGRDHGRILPPLVCRASGEARACTLPCHMRRGRASVLPAVCKRCKPRQASPVEQQAATIAAACRCIE